MSADSSDLYSFFWSELYLSRVFPGKCCLKHNQISPIVKWLWLSEDSENIFGFFFFFPFACETGLNVLYILKDLAYKEKSRLKALQNSSCADVYDLWAQN